MKLSTKHAGFLFGIIGLSLLLLRSDLWPAVAGAIFTTTSTGQTVNANIYGAKEDVYLNGGPQPNAPCTAAALPDGNYYFQVTDPSGSVLLSEDEVANREVTVSGGLIVSTSGNHATGTGKCPGSISVQLFPYLDTPNPGGEYKAWMTPVANYDPLNVNSTFGFVNSHSKTDNFKVKKGGEVAITGFKFYDTNTNGVPEAGEPLIGGWKIVKTPPTTGDVDFTETTTPSIGQYSFLVEPNSGDYTITEVPPTGFFPVGIWLPTTPTSGTVTVGSTDMAGPDFGNVCVGPGGGRTLGFWSNKNGQALFGNDDLALMVSLNLRNANGSDFDPASYAAFRTWLLNATATNMAYMLSAQLAAMELNVNNGFVSGGSLIYAPGTASANAAGFATVSAIMEEANIALGTDGLTLAGSPNRAYQEALKNALDLANNNKTFVQPQPCAFTTPY